MVSALKSYDAEYNEFPAGISSNVVCVLAGDNLRKIVFLSYHRDVERPNEMMDPWKTPYQIRFIAQTNFIISSAGKDKTFGTKDDIIFNSVSNNFVKP